MNAEVRYSSHLRPNEAGTTMCVNGRHIITSNAANRPERQRFTVLHEVAHIALELFSRHGDAVDVDTLFNYARRPPEEVICDVFAAECPPPHEFLLRDLNGAEPGFELVGRIGERY